MVQLLLCDSCRRVVDPAALEGGQGARMADKVYCGDCVPGGPGRPPDATSCAGCQVAVVHAAITSGGEPDYAAHAICVRCEKNPVRDPAPGPNTVACEGCGTTIALRDLRIGVALPLGERAYCGACRGRVEPGRGREAERQRGGEAESRRTVPPAFAGAAAATQNAPAQVPGTRHAAPGAENPAPVTRHPAPDGAPTCDRCGREVTTDELRTGAARVVDGAIQCPRCLGRSSREAAQKRDRRKLVTSLVFILGVFPVLTASLVVVVVLRFMHQGDEKPANGGRPAKVETAPPAAPVTGSAPASGTPAPAARADEFQAAFTEMLRAIREAVREERTGRPAVGPAEPPRVDPAPAPNGPKPLPPITKRDLTPKDERPAPGPGAEVARRLGSDRAAAERARLADPDPGIRLDAILELAALPAEDATDALVAALDDADPFLRSVAAMALSRVESPASVRPLLARLSDPDQRVRRAVAQALSRITKSEKFYLFEDLTPEQLRALRKAIDARDGSSG